MSNFLKQIAGFDSYAHNVKRRIDTISDIAEAKTVYEYDGDGEVIGSKSYPNLDVRVTALENAIGIDASSSSEENDSLVKQMQTAINALQNNVNNLNTLPDRVTALENSVRTLTTKVTALETWKTNTSALLVDIQENFSELSDIPARVKAIETQLGIDPDAQRVDNFFEFDMSKNIMPAQNMSLSNIFELDSEGDIMFLDGTLSADTENPRFEVASNGDIMPIAA